MQRHRANLRARGLRAVQVWVPDVRNKAFIVEAARQSRILAGSPHEAEEQAWVDAVSVPVFGDER